MKKNSDVRLLIAAQPEAKSGRRLRLMLCVLCASVVSLASAGCKVVEWGEHRLDERIMQFGGSTTEAASEEKFFPAREGSAGGSGRASGGGCGCS